MSCDVVASVKSVDVILEVWPFLKVDAIELYFAVVAFVVVYIISLAFESVDEIIKWDYSSESCCYWVCLLLFCSKKI